MGAAAAMGEEGDEASRRVQLQSHTDKKIRFKQKY